jgi:transcriptional regulator with XRE-family HTH domain
MISAENVAAKLEISASGYSKLERMEFEKKISLETLARAAEALDCELIYAIRPKRRMRFSQLIWQKLVGEARLHSWVQRSSRQTKPAAVAMVASRLFNDADFRKRQGWKNRREFGGR